MHSYIAKFKSKENIQIFSKMYGNILSTVSECNNVYFIYTNNSFVLDDLCESYEYRTKNRPAWRPINWQYRIQGGALYNDYLTHRFIDGFDSAGVGDPEEGILVGPWYAMTGYMGLLDTWNVTQGSGVIVTCQERFDYTHPGYHITDTAWDRSNWSSVYTEITGGTHNFFLIDTNNLPEISGLLNKCYFYARGNEYSLNDGNGCISGDLNNYGGYSYYEPGTCYSNWFSGQGGFETCLDGTWNWDTGNVPSGFSPFGHGDIVTSVIGARRTPIDNITGWGQIIGNVGVAPMCSILLGDNGDIYNETETILGAQIRIGAFEDQWSQLEADVAYSGGTILVRGPGTIINCNIEALNQEKPIKTIQIAPASYMGSETHIAAITGQDYTNSGNYGMYAGYGRSNYANFASPAVGVWGHHPRYNHRNWGAWGAAYDGVSISAAVGGGLLALMKSLHADWSWEDITTAICQSCKPYEIRTVPSHNLAFGLATIESGTDFRYNEIELYISGSNLIDNSVSWYYAYPSGESFNGKHEPYKLLQAGAGPDDPNYEIILYENMLYDDGECRISGGDEPYSGGRFLGLVRGYAGTIPKEHNTDASYIYTPLITRDTWSPYMGWGLPNMRAAIAVTDKTLSILPPQKFTVSGHEYSDNYARHYTHLEITPFRSSNYGGVIVVKNNRRYPRNINDGTICFKSNDATHDVITGFDYLWVSMDMYYSAFQVTKGPKFTYSKSASYAQGIVNSPETWTITPVENGNTLTAYISRPPETSYAKISGYWNLSKPIGQRFTTKDYYVTTGLSKGDNVAMAFYTFGESHNLLGTSDLTNDYQFLVWDDISTAESGTYSIQKYHEGNNDLWSACLTISGINNGSVGFGSNWKALNTTYSGHNFSAYARLLSGSGVMNMYVSDYSTFGDEGTYLGSTLIASYDLTAEWARYDCIIATGDFDELSSGQRFRFTVSGVIADQYCSALIVDTQISSGNKLYDYSTYIQPRIGESTVDGNISVAMWSYDFGGSPTMPSNIVVDLHDNYMNIGITRIVDSNESKIEIIGEGGVLIDSLEPWYDGETKYVSSGGFYNTRNIPKSVKIINDQNRFTVSADIIYNDYRNYNSIYHKYTCENDNLLINGNEPSFSDGTLISGEYPLTISLGNNTIPDNLLPMYNAAIPLYIKRKNSSVNAYVSLFASGSGSIHHIGTTNSDSILYIRKPQDHSLKIQAVTVYGTYIESNVIEVRDIFTLAVMTDNHIPSSSHAVRVARCIEWAVDNSTNLIGLAMCGDANIALGPVGSGTDYTSWVYDTGGGNLPSSIPIIPVIGNHDTEIPWNGPYEQTPAQPHATIQSEYSNLFGGKEWYAWDYKKLLRIAVVNNLTDYLSTGYMGNSGESMYYNCNPPGYQSVLNDDHSGISIPGSEQCNWLDSVFDSEHPWKIVMCHRALWAPFDSDPRRQNRLARPAMAVPINKGVSLICQGDIHIGAFSGPWYPTAPDYEEYRNPGEVGAYSLVLGGGYYGRKVEDNVLPDQENTCHWSTDCKGTGNLGKVHVTLLQFEGNLVKMKIFECKNWDTVGRIVYQARLIRNPGV